tara:strand:- start:118 stop:453 length:336 start_codon:yes stop_codon:yes gene_type:complete
MLETFAIEYFTKQDQREGFDENASTINISIGTGIVAIIIAIGAAYLAYCCNSHETPATKFITTLFAFLFSGIYVLYYFIRYVLMGQSCGGGSTYTIKRKSSKKGRKKKSTK